MATTRIEIPPYVPHEPVSRILARLPVRSLLRFRCVSKDWSDAVGEGFFIRAHLHHQNPSVLIAPKIANGDLGEGTITGLYRWNGTQEGAATLVHPVVDQTFRLGVAEHRLAHCDGLVLLPSETTVRVLNLATRRHRTLPCSSNVVMSRGFCTITRLRGRQAFGLGYDSRSSTYKVASLFYRSLEYMRTTFTYHYTLGLEIFTIGTNQQNWRETAASPTYPVMSWSWSWALKPPSSPLLSGSSNEGFSPAAHRSAAHGQKNPTLTSPSSPWTN